MADNLAHAFAAAEKAREACALAQAKLDGHWARGGEVQRSLHAAAEAGAAATASAQAARRRAQLLAARLDAAAMLVEAGSKSAQMSVQ